MSQPIFITGYMCSGKTTFGRALAKRLNREFIDLDFFIEQRFHTSVANLFATRGEEEFRRLECALLREVGEFEDVVISCGGGTPTHGGNMEYMNSRGLTVMMDADEKCLLRRLTEGAAKRPLVAGKSPDEILEFMRSHIAARLPFYSLAKIKFPSDQLEDRRQINNTIEKFLTEHGHEI